MKQDQPLHFGQRLMSQHGGKDGPRRDRHGPGRQRDQGRDAQRNRQKHDESQGTEPDPFLPADLGRAPCRGETGGVLDTVAISIAKIRLRS